MASTCSQPLGHRTPNGRMDDSSSRDSRTATFGGTAGREGTEDIMTSRREITAAGPGMSREFMDFGRVMIFVDGDHEHDWPSSPSERAARHPLRDSGDENSETVAERFIGHRDDSVGLGTRMPCSPL